MRKAESMKLYWAVYVDSCRIVLRPKKARSSRDTFYSYIVVFVPLFILAEMVALFVVFWGSS